MAIVIGVICLAAGITVLAVRISAPDGTAAPVSLGPAGTAGPAGAVGVAGVAGVAGPDTEATAAGSTPPGWYPVSPGGPQRWWDGTRWVLTQPPPSE